ncbi:MAG TPA: sporulation protein YpjB [Bacillota bacterium]|nr:sporulation protein YpjB [Bacillota bacterium]
MYKKLYILLILIFTILLSYTPIALGATDYSQTNPSATLDQLSEQLLELTEQGKFAEAKQRLDELSSLYPQVGAQKLSIEALAIVSETLVNAKRSFAAVRPDKNAMLWSANQVRLLMDALTHPNQPMWKSYHSIYRNQIDKMIAAVDKGDSKSFNNELKDNLNLYNLLRPCFAIHQTPQTIEMMDSLYNFLVKRTQLEQLNGTEVHSSLEQLRQVSDGVFLGKEQNTLSLTLSSNSPITMITIMSSILLSVLTYVGWRMYCGTRYTT